MIGALSSDLARQVRSQCREKNTNSVTDVDLYDALSRAYDYAIEFVATLYPDPLIESRVITVTDGTFDLPEDIYSDRIQKILDVSDNYSRKVDRRSYAAIEELPITGTHPEYYVVTGRTVTLYPPASGVSLRVFYCRQAEPVVKPLGRIKAISGSTISFATIDSDLATNLTIQAGELSNHFNIVDGRTGIIKGTYQVSAVNTTVGTVTIEGSPSPTTILNRTVSSSIDSDIEENDYLCPVFGSCLLYYPKPTANLVMQYAVTEIRRSLGQDVGVEESAMKRVEKQLKSSWTGRESTKRVRQENKIWYRRRIY